MIAWRVLPVLAAFGAGQCGQRTADMSRADSVAMAERGNRVAERLADSATGTQRGVPIARWVLPPALAEVSGLAFLSDDRIVAHGDELGVISVMDPRRGTLIKQFSIGARGDFEGITVVDGVIYLLASNGQLYAFREGGNGQRVSYTMHDTRLGRECEFEGVAYDPRRAALLLTCKHVLKKSLRNNVVIYIWSLNPATRPRLSVLAIPVVRAVQGNPWKTLRPTDITVDPTTGHYVLIAGPEQALLELTPNGEVVQTMPLPGGDEHQQAEGVAVSKDGLLIVADEAAQKPAFITLYRWPLAPAVPVAP